MLSLFAKAPSSPRAVASQETVDAKTMMKFWRENKQLRRELEDAHHRIHELEAAVAAAAEAAAESSKVVIFSNDMLDADDDDDDMSVEVQSLDNGTISVTSSTTTIPTGSLLANEERTKLQQRDDYRDQKGLRNSNRRRRKNTQTRKSSKGKSSLASLFLDPYGELMRTQSETLSTLLEDVPDDCSLPFLMSSSVSSSSGISDRSGEVSSDVSTKTQTLSINNSNDTTKTTQVASIAMRYLARMDSSDSEFSSSIKGEGFAEI